MKKPKIFVCLDDDVMTHLIGSAKKRIAYAAPSISEKLAQSIVWQSHAYPQLKVDVILDVDAQSLRLGYGQIGGLQYLSKHSINIRCCPGLKIGILAVDHRSFVFSPTAKIIEHPEYGPPNAININPTMTDWLLHALVPRDMLIERVRREISCFDAPNKPDPDQPGDLPQHEEEFDDEVIDPEPMSLNEEGSLESNCNSMEPEIGTKLFQPEEMEALVEDIVKRPPKQFDHERKVLVYNGYLRFVDIKFTGGRLSARTVQLPENILTLAKGRPEVVEVKATCKVFEGASLLSKVEDFERRVDEVRRCYTKPLGNDLGRVVLNTDLAMFGKEIIDLSDELEDIRTSSVVKIAAALKRRKKRLKKILFPILMKNPDSDLQSLLRHAKPSKHEIVGRYLATILDEIFPEAEAMIEKMDFTCIYKDVTWEMLNDERFGEAIRRLYPDEEFTKLYLERNTIGERIPVTKNLVGADDEWPSELG